MQRRYELIDMVAVVGLCATIAVGGLLLTAANGAPAVMPGGQTVSESLTGKVDGMQWLQPGRGQVLTVASLILMSLFSAGLLVSPRLSAVGPDGRGRIGAVVLGVA